MPARPPAGRSRSSRPTSGAAATRVDQAIAAGAAGDRAGSAERDDRGRAGRGAGRCVDAGRRAEAASARAAAGPGGAHRGVRRGGRARRSPRPRRQRRWPRPAPTGPTAESPRPSTPASLGIGDPPRRRGPPPAPRRTLRSTAAGPARPADAYRQLAAPRRTSTATPPRPTWSATHGRRPRCPAIARFAPRLSGRPAAARSSGRPAAARWRGRRRRVRAAGGPVLHSADDVGAPRVDRRPGLAGHAHRHRADRRRHLLGLQPDPRHPGGPPRDRGQRHPRRSTRVAQAAGLAPLHPAPPGRRRRRPLRPRRRLPAGAPARPRAPRAGRVLRLADVAVRPAGRRAGRRRRRPRGRPPGGRAHGRPRS